MKSYLDSPSCILLGVGAVDKRISPLENKIPLNKLKEEAGFGDDENASSVSITVVGASGDLAKKKIFPALFALYYEDCLPKVFFFCGLVSYNSLYEIS